MSPALRLMLLAAALLSLQVVHAYSDDEEDEDEDEGYRNRPRSSVRAVTPRDRYEAKLDMLNARLERQRLMCKAQGSSGMSYCAKAVDQAEYEGRHAIEREYKEALAKEGKTP